MCGLNKKIFLKAFVLSFILVIVCINSSNGQFSMNEYLSEARNDVRLYENKIKSEFLEKNPYRSPVIHRVEFRSRTNDYNISQDDFRLRLNPTNPFEIGANKKYYNLETNSLIVNYQFALNKAIYGRYNQVISFFQITEEISFKEKEILLQRDQLKILEAGLNDNDFEISEYIKQKENLINLILDLNELIHNKEKIKHRIKSEFSFSGTIHTEHDVLISYDKIKEIVDLKSTVPDTANNIHLENLNRQVMLEEQRIRVEKAEGRRNIGYVQAEYDRYRGIDFNRHFGVQFGVRLPITNADKPDLNRRRIDLIEDKADIIREKTALDVQCDLLKLDLEFLFNQNDLISGAITNDNLLKLLSQDRNLKPEELIEAQKSIHKMKKYERLIQWDIYKSFIDYLYYSGKLIEVPLRNYLLENLDEI
jgi:hypothetical protein